MELFLLLIGLIVGIILGFWIGERVSDNNWKGNAYNPQRVLKNGCFYKVVLIDYLSSWHLAFLHCDFPIVGCEDNEKGTHD